MIEKEVAKFEAIFDILEKSKNKPICAEEIRNQTQMSLPLIYSKMATLKDLGLVKSERKSRKKVYTKLSNFSFRRMIEMIEQYRKNKKDPNFQAQKLAESLYEQNQSFHEMMSERRKIFKKYRTIPIIY